MSEPVTTPLTKTQAAYVALVLEEHTALIRNADATRDKRMVVVFTELGIPLNALVKTVQTADGFALVYTP